MAKIIKEKPDLLEVMKAAGVDVSSITGRKQGMCRCPFHNDQGKPNMAVYTLTGRFICFRCGTGGDVYDFVGLQEYGDSWNNRDRTMFIEVLKKLSDKNIPMVPINTEVAKVAPEAQVEVYHILSLAERIYNLALTSPVGDEARKYLASRKIDTETIRKLKLGFAAPGALAGQLIAYPKKLETAAVDAGLYYEGREWLQGRVIFPDITDKGVVKHMVGRSLIPKASLRYMSLPGLSKTLYRLGACNKKLNIIVTESMIDTVNLWQMGFQGVGVNGTGLPSHLEAELVSFPRIYFLPQNDDAGRDGVERWKKIVPHGITLNIPYKSDEKDVNDLVCRYGLEKTKEIITNSMIATKNL